MPDVALEIPLRTLCLGRLLKRNHSGRAWIQVLGKPLDRAAFTSGIATLEQGYYSLPCCFRPALRFQKLYLQLLLVRFVNRPLDFRFVRVATLSEQVTNLFRAMADLGVQVRCSTIFCCRHTQSLTHVTGRKL